jgi:hypothetical protein
MLFMVVLQCYNQFAKCILHFVRLSKLVFVEQIVLFRAIFQGYSPAFPVVKRRD